MKPTSKSVLFPLLLGLGSLVVLYPAMNGLSPSWFSVLAGVLFLAIGLGLGRSFPKSLWYAPLLLNLPQWVVFYPLMMLRPDRIYLFLIPLAAAYAGLYLGRRFLAGKESAALPGLSYLLSRYLMPPGLGFLLMFATLVLHLMAMMALMDSPYVFNTFYITYPLMYALAAGLLAHSRNWWLSDACLLCLLPILYWVVLQTSKSQASPDKPLPCDMIITMGVTLLLSITTAFLVNRRKAKNRETSG